MSEQAASRPGGRSARVQTAVHNAAQDLQAELDRECLTIPLIAERAGVNPTTIYRRWGTLDNLLADVAIERLQPEQIPVSLGNFRADLIHWMTAFFDEMTSAPGRAMLREVLGTQGHACTGKCDDYIRQQLTVIIERAAAQRAPHLMVDTVVQFVIAPLMYRMLFNEKVPTEAEIMALVDKTLEEKL